MYEIVSDGALDLGLERTNELGVYVVPFYVSPDGGENHKKEIIELKVRDFYQYLIDNPTIFPKTSMPSLQDYLDVFEEIAKTKKDIICLTISSKLSGSYNSAIAAKQILEENYPDIKVTVIDTTVVTGLQGMLVEEVMKMKKANYTYEQMIEKIEKLKMTGRVFFTLQTMDYLVHGGRVGKLSGMAAGKLGIKPIITLQDGELLNGGIARGRKKAISKAITNLISYFKENHLNPNDYLFGIGFGYDQDETVSVIEKLQKEILEEYPDFHQEINTFQIGATIAVHTGPDPLGIAILKKEF